VARLANMKIISQAKIAEAGSYVKKAISSDTILNVEKA